MATAPVRKNFEFDPRYSEMITSLKKVCGLKTETSVMEEALVLFAWAAAEAGKGNKVGAYDEEKGVLREITSPALEKARHWGPETAQRLPLKRAM